MEHAAQAATVFTPQTMLAIFLPQILQPTPEVRLATVASHSCPFLHLHQTSLSEPGTTSRGVKSGLRVGCHCSAISGYRVSRQLSSVASFPAQAGHPLCGTPVRLLMIAVHWCAGFLLHLHHTSLFE